MKRSGVVINFWLRLSTEPESTWPQEEGEGEAGCLSMSIQSKDTNLKLPATEQGQENLGFTKLRIHRFDLSNSDLVQLTNFLHI